jgi:hypothetical protein
MTIEDHHFDVFHGVLIAPRTWFRRDDTVGTMIISSEHDSFLLWAWATLLQDSSCV